MAKVEWSRLGGDQCEALLGILLLRRHPLAQRVRPGRGDRGVDIYVPRADGWTVYQVKSFTGALDTSRKNQISKSWSRFVELVMDKRPTIDVWHVVRPENPSWGDIEFVEELTQGAEWSCSWKGLDFCDELAASYPEVVDYYLHDGKERLEEKLRQFLTVAGFARHAESAAVTPGTSVDVLSTLHESINSLDPHYRYDFSVERAVGSLDDSSWPRVEPSQGLIAATILTEPAKQRSIIFKIYARYPQAPEDRPIPGSFTVIAAPDTPAAQQFRDFLDFGLPTGNLPVVNLMVDLPGDLGGERSEGFIRLGPSEPESTVRDRWIFPAASQVVVRVSSCKIPSARWIYWWCSMIPKAVLHTS